MSFGITDVLMHPPLHSASFVANSAAPAGYVPVTVPAGAGVGALKTLDGRDHFELGDNFIILSIGCVLPLGYELWNDAGYNAQGYDLWVVKKGGVVRHDLALPHLWAPFANYEMSLGMFFYGSGLGDPAIDDDFYLTAKFTALTGWNLRISMYNAPVALDAKEFYVPIFVKVLHSYPLYEVPS